MDRGISEKNNIPQKYLSLILSWNTGFLVHDIEIDFISFNLDF
jgi:hypothetical protein